MRPLLAVLALVLSAAAASAAVTDQALRYVNGEVVTMSDVRLRYEIRKQDYLREGRVLPSTREERIAFDQESLEALTDEILMVQKAKELKLVPDHDRVVLDVLERAKELGTGLSLADQARARRERERQQSIEYLLNYFYAPRTPEATPAELMAAYRVRQSEFHRPASGRILVILLRPSDPSLGKDLRRAEVDLFKRAQDATDAAVAAAATSRIEEFTAPDTKGADQDRLLAAFLAELAALAPREDLDEGSRKLVAAAQDLLAQAASIRDLDATVKELEAQRTALALQPAAVSDEGFRACARKLSQGPNAAEGGEQNWEPGIFPAEVDQQVLATAPAGMTPVFVANQTAWLVHVLQRAPARVQTFDEVSGQLEAELRRQHRLALRAKVTGILRTKASITNVAPVSSLLD
jgi:hypothetical protein